MEQRHRLDAIGFALVGLVSLGVPFLIQGFLVAHISLAVLRRMG
jgi:hypothetical protein